MMQIMDTNISQIDKLNEYEWGYLNGYCDVKLIESIQKNFNDFSSQIKVSDLKIKFFFLIKKCFI